MMRILLLEDSWADAELIGTTLKKSINDCDFVRVETRTDFIKALKTETLDLILADYALPSFDGFSALELARAICPEVPFIIISGILGEERAIETLKSGATDYVLKQRLERLVPAVKRALREAEERKLLRQAETELRKSEELFRTSVETILDCFAIYSAIRDTSGKIIDFRIDYVNAAACENHGLTQEEQLGKWLCKLMPVHQTSGLFTEYCRVVETGQPLVKELLLEDEQESRGSGGSVRSEGSVRSGGINNQPPITNHQQPTINNHQQPTTDHQQSTRAYDIRAVKFGDGVVVTWRDTTERRQVEEERKQLIAQEQAARAEAEKANRLKDEFLAVVSHELRTPLNSMLGWAQILKNRQLNEAIATKALETIERNARHQKKLIEDILDVSMIIQNKLRLELQPLYLVPIVHAAIEDVQPQAQAKSIKIESMLSPFISPVMGDAERLQQIVCNLLSNAIKFTPAAGQVQISLQQIESFAQITVTDTGQGISSDFLPHVFDRFRQADGTTTRKYGGLGLGLAIVRHLVEMHHGRVYATSEGIGKGATFTVQLPIYKIE
ncbi:hybrid sensor histidine kinase/response regulator [Fischerella thermalis CCMEE 5268]|uniref:histidine kinase n=1 Tax=Fischerella thermalis CCMEE 5268 TaxID=2019662 RepID=A0A2N6KB36_9CYAN|nr:ATP-binding protein [Fischerella thermalis]PLZ95690.1 hybrid sensor histidine kinase/response regulator [Fischerella thermalis CCMEE 5268]